MKYKLHPDVSVEEICGTYLLIASGDAKSKFDYVRVLNEVGAEILTLLQENKTIEEIVHELVSEYDILSEDIRPGITRFLQEMETKGYLIQVIGDEK